MKKLLAIIVSVVLVLGTALVCGCGDATFDGNYSEMSDEQVAAYLAEMGNYDVEPETNALNCQVEMKMSSSAEGGKMDVELNYKQVIDATDGILLSGKVKMSDSYQGQDGKTVSENRNSEIWYKSGYAYAKLEDRKEKMAISADMFIANISGAYEQMEGIDFLMGCSLREAIEMLQMVKEDKDASAKIYMDKGDKQSKCKIEVKNMTYIEGLKVDITLYFVYDNAYNMLGFKCEAKTVANNNDMNASFYFTIKGYDGKIDFPADLDTYVEVNYR